MILKHSVLCLAAMGALSVAGCSGAKKQLGLDRQGPNEFAVVKRAPLEKPPNYGLRPPRPGAPRPQEDAPIDQARAHLFGQGAEAGAHQESGVTDGEARLLNQAGVRNIDPSIRDTVDREAGEDTRPVAERLLGIAGFESDAPADVVDAKAEAQRLRENREAGRPVTEGETPSVTE